MIENTRMIYTENPENDLWRELLQYTYKANIQRFFRNCSCSVSDETINCIIGSFHQAYEYYKASEVANLQIAPLLLYYGSTNLLYGMSSLKNKCVDRISNHGMKIDVSENNNFIADTSIRFLSPADGGVHIFARALNCEIDLTSFGDWILRDFFDSIPEISDNYLQCYGGLRSKVVFLDVFNTPDGKIEKVYFNSSDENEVRELLASVDGLATSYLPITPTKNPITNEEYFILRHKINGENIDQISYSGQPYLRASHKKGQRNVSIPTILNMYISLFALSSLCRYHPERWSPFVINDSTGERLLVEKLLYYARRIIPNIVLDNIEGKRTQYVSDKYQAVDTVRLVGEHQIQDIVRKEVRRLRDKEIIANMNKK